LPKFLHIFFIIVIAVGALALTGINACRSSSPTQSGGGDTTSHNFTWKIDTLGTQTSYINDVCIINDTDIWVVGEIHNDSTDRNDSAGFYLEPFNAAHWDGAKWNLVRIGWEKMYVDTNKNNSVIVYPMSCVFAFSPTDIWVSGNGQKTLDYGDGRNWNGIVDNGSYDGGYTKMWGTNDHNMLLGGHNGTLVRWDGKSFNPITLDNTNNVEDIYGYMDASGQITEAMCLTSSNSGTNPGTQLYQYTQSHLYWEPVNSNLPIAMTSTWFSQGGSYYCVGDGAYKISSFGNNNTWQQMFSTTDTLSYYVDAIRGNAWNDIVIAGTNGTVGHYNGSSWWRYAELANPYDELWRADMKNNLIVAVGERYYNGMQRIGVIYMGKR